MSDLKRIPVVQEPVRARSGEKYLTAQGFTAIRDGVKAAGSAAAHRSPPKPSWLRAKAPGGAGFDAVRDIVREHRLARCARRPSVPISVNAGMRALRPSCSWARCAPAPAASVRWIPAIRAAGWTEEPANAARTVALMQLKYVVLTSVNRDDLPDGGAGHYAACVRAIQPTQPEHRGGGPDPGFSGRPQGCAKPWSIRDCRCSHRMWRPSAASRIRCAIRAPAMTDPQGAGARQAPQSPDLTKTSLMLGLGETDAEVLRTMDDLRAAGSTC